MLSVAICDDDYFSCSILERMIKKYAITESLNISVECFFTGENLLKELEATYYDIIFLDIELKGKLNGIDVSSAIRNNLQLNFVNIVFVSGHTEYAMQLFQARPVDFLLKPIIENKVSDVLNYTVKALSVPNSYFTYKDGGSERKISLKDIMYFSCGKQLVYIHTIKKKFYFYGTLKDTFEKVQKANGSFIFCYRSYIVNYVHIAAIHSTFFELTNGDWIPIGENKKEESKRLFSKYDMREVQP